jgi:acetyltransferase-like isoleucine patch superfamily enzyme
MSGELSGDGGSPVLKRCGIVGARFGEGVTVVEPSNVYGCELGDGCFVGPFVEIQKDVSIGPRTKIQSHSFVCELVTIGADCFVGHGVMFINDLFSGGGPARGDKTKWRSTRIGNGVSIGSNATILPVTICDGAVIGAGAVVTKDIAEPGVYAGNPARRLREKPAQK